MENNNRERTSLWVIAGRVVFTVALIACIWFIFSNSMAVATVSSGSSGRVLAWMRIILRRLGQPGLAEHLTMHIVRKLAHFCEYTLEGFLLMLCMRVYSRHPLRHITVPMLGGVLRPFSSSRRDAAVKSPMCGWILPVFWPASLLPSYCCWPARDCIIT